MSLPNNSKKQPKELKKSKNQNYRVSAGKIIKVECRYCRQKKLKQNYKEHLKAIHPGKDYTDESTWGDIQCIPINDLFKKKANKNKIDVDNISGVVKVDNKENINDKNSLQTFQGENDRMDYEPHQEHVEIDENKTYDVKNDKQHEPKENETNKGDNIYEFKINGNISEDCEVDALKEVLSDIDSNSKTNINLKNENHPSINSDNNVLNDISVKLDKVLDSLQVLNISPKNCEEDCNDVKQNKVEDSCENNENQFDQLLFSCKSIQDIENKWRSFVSFICGLDSGDSFQYDKNLPQDFTSSKQIMEFRNLKKNLKRHLSRQSHIKALEDINTKHEVLIKEESRNEAVSMRIGRICYYLYKTGRPDKDFELLIYLHASNNADIGDINHSWNFASNFLPVIADEIQTKVIEFFTERLPQTGFRPPSKILADKATHKHRSRQLIGLLTIVPDSPHLIVPFFVGIPVVKEHNGKGVSINIWTVTDNYIEGEQYKGLSADGQYKVLHVPTFLDTHYNVVGHFDWDPMHKAGRSDLKARDKAEWIKALTDNIQKSFKLVNWGKMFEKFFDNVEELSKNNFDIELKLPKFYSTTKMPNHVVTVNSAFREDFPALVKTFKETVEDLKSGSSKDNTKSAEIGNLLQKIFNVSFAVHLSGSIDIYSIFSNGVNILQTVNMLPITRYDLFQSKCISKFEAMIETVEPKKCACVIDETKPCLWPMLHKDIKEMELKNSYRNVPMTTLMTNELKTRSGTVRARENLLQNKSQVIAKCLKNLSDFVKSLYELMKDGDSGVFDNSDIQMIEHLRILLDIKAITIKVKYRGSSQVASLDSNRFIESAKVVAVELKEMGDEELRRQHRLFLRKLEKLIENMDEKDFDNMKMIQHFLSSKNKFYEDIELVMHAIATAAITKSIESVIESWVSVSECRSHNKRQITEERMHNELVVALNGPVLQHADDIIKSAMKKYWKKSKHLKDKSGHFVRRSENILDFSVSKVVDKMIEEPPKIPFLCPSCKAAKKIKFY